MGVVVCAFCGHAFRSMMATDFFEQMQAMKDRGEVDESQVRASTSHLPACHRPIAPHCLWPSMQRV